MEEKKTGNTLFKRVERELENASWDEAEEVGMKILGMCIAKRVLIGENPNFDMVTLMQKITDYGNEWIRNKDLEVFNIAFNRKKQ